MVFEKKLPREEFRPIPIPRKGELVAWLLTAIAGISWLILSQLGYPVGLGLKVMTMFLTASALIISLGNWVDRHTRIRYEPDGISFKNGLRKSFLSWEDIQRVEVLPSTWGNKVRVVSQNSHFDFRTLAEVKLNGKIKGCMGFEAGEHIMQYIITSAQLSKSIIGNDEQLIYSKE